MTFLLVVLVSAFHFLNLQIGFLQKKYYDLRNFRPLILLFYVLYAFIFAFIPLVSHFLWVSVAFLPLFLLPLALFMHEKHREKVFQEKFSAFLEKIILKIQNGAAFRSALAQVLEESDAFVQQKLKKVLDAIRFERDQRPIIEDPFLKMIYDELNFMEKSPHYSLQRLQSWRRELKLQENFRRRSGQVVYQIRFQSIFMTLLYIALLFYVCQTFAWKDIRELLTWSLAFFLLGAVLVVQMGRRMKWKI